MTDLVLFAVAAFVWVALQTWILPRMGVPT
jgi:hypothetical protein